jgi:hypothetical protein
VASTVALIVKVWVRALPGVGTQRASTPAPPARASPHLLAAESLPSLAPAMAATSAAVDGERAVDAPGPASSLAVTEFDGGVPEVAAPAAPATAAAPTDAGASPNTASPIPLFDARPLDAGIEAPSAVAAAPVDVGTASAEVSKPPPEARLIDRVFVETLVGGGALGAAIGTIAPSLAGRVDVGLDSRVGLQLWGGWDGTLTAALGPGSVSVRRQAFGIDGRVTFFPRASTASRISLTAGPALQRLEGTGSHYRSDSSVVELDPGIALGAMWLETFAGGFSAWAGLDARAWLSQDSFQIRNLGVAITPPQQWLGLQIGLAYRWH